MNYSSTYLAKRLLRYYLRPQLKFIILAVLCMGVVAACAAGNALIMKPVLDDIFIHHDAQMLNFIPLVILAIAIISGLADYGQILAMRYVGQRIISNMQIELFRHMLKSDLSLFHNYGAGHLLSRFINDINLIRSSLSTLLVILAKQALTLVFLFAVMLHQSWQLTLISFAAYPLAIYPLVRWSRRLRRLFARSQEQIGELSTQLSEVFQGVRTVKAYGREAYEAEHAKNTIEGLFKLYFRAARVGAASSPLMQALGGIAVAAVVWYGGYQVLEGVTTPGAFGSFMASLLMAYRPAKAMTGIGTTFQEGLAAAERTFTLLDIPPSIIDRPGTTSLRIDKGHIVFDNVTFQYAGDTAGVEQVSLEVPAGKKAALVGLSGGGKSTLMNLLLRFYDVSSGSITIDGQDIRNVTLHSLRSAMAFVPQESMLFDDTVRANIAYGREGATDAEIISAAKHAAADGFIRELPHGYDTLVGSQGVRLSGGQRQRLAIARAMLKNAPILLLDEATSSLDNESERSIQQALSTLMQGRTTLVIAHRLTTIVNADIIYVVESGRIIESGTHQALMHKQGKYYQLYAQNFAMEQTG